MADIKALEHSTLIVPYESLNRSFRNAQKIVDREVSHVNSVNEKIKKLSSKSNVKITQTAKELDDVIAKLHVLKSKSNDEKQQTQCFHTGLACLKSQIIV